MATPVLPTLRYGEKIGARQKKDAGDNIYKALVFFDKMYDIMNEAEKRDFVTQLIQKVEVYEERQPNGQWLKAIEFKLPIIEHDMKLSLDNGDSVESVVLLPRSETTNREG